MKSQQIILGAGCFWGVERLFWELPGVWTTYVSYSGGRRENPTYEEVCMGVTGHVETVNVFYDQKQIRFETILKTFWECHDPTQGMRQGNDIGDSYRSHIFTTSSEQREEAFKMISDIESSKKWPGKIVTKVTPAEEFWEAESYHQDYLVKNPNGYTCHFPRADWTI